VYFLAVLNRTTLGVAGLTAERRFHITPAQLSVFVLLQIGVYAIMQIPSGLLADRYGPRRMLFAAALVMGLAQLAFAEIDSYPVALLARAFLGGGDSMTFIAVLRLIAARFPVRRYPMFVGLTSTIGQVGNLVATLPLTLLLRDVGWASTFAVAGALSLAVGVAVWLLLDDRSARPARTRGAAQVRRGAASIRGRIEQAWSAPGTRLGFWVHCSAAVPTTLLVLWGHPYLVKGAGFSDAAASSVLLMAVVFTACGSLAVGSIMVRRPQLRAPMALGQCVATFLAWALLLGVFSGRPPQALVIAVFAISALGGPASLIAFSLTRDFSPHRTLGTASGLVNTAGFTGVIIASLSIGAILDIVGGSAPGDYRRAFTVLVVVEAVVTLKIALWTRRMHAISAPPPTAPLGRRRATARTR